jgi:hypothetical protein
MSLLDLLPINGINGAVNAAGDVVRDALGIGKTKSSASGRAKDGFENFKQEVLDTGLANESRYEVFFGTPTCLIGSPYAQYLRSTLMRVESVTYPPQMLQTKARHTFGVPRPMPTGMDYGGSSGVTMTIVMDRDMNSKKLFDYWMDSIVSYDTQLVAYSDTYTTDVVIGQLDKLDGTIYTVALEDAYPKIVSSMSGSAGSQGFQKVTVTFAYSKWSCVDIESKKLQGAVESQQLINAGGIPAVNNVLGQAKSTVDTAVKQAGQWTLNQAPDDAKYYSQGISF